MKMKVFEADTEENALQIVKKELGANAVILNIKKTTPKGILKFFRKKRVEVTAAYEEKDIFEQIHEKEQIHSDLKEDIHTIEKVLNQSLKDEKIAQQEEVIKELERKLDSAQDLFAKVLQKQTEQLDDNAEIEKEPVIQLFYSALLDNGVSQKVADDILKEAQELPAEYRKDVNFIVKLVYNKIIKILGTPQTIQFDPNNSLDEPVIVFLIGPTGVGKTTTIAKLSSYFILQKDKKVGLITADTYRIAAVDQLKTYAEILGLPVEVVYNPEDLQESIELLKKSSDLIIVDTAGRSHKNEKNMQEIERFLLEVPDSYKFLVLSMTTKYEDLMSIIQAYKQICDFRIIFTKTDETMCLGTILNICYEVNKPLSYITNGQNVPEDFDVIHPEEIAKALLRSIDI